MASRDNASLFEVGVDVLGSSVSETTKKILLQTGANVGEGQVHADNVELFVPAGIASRPANPVKGKASAQAFVVRQGGQDIALGVQDQRGLDLYGQLQPGETCLYAIGDGTAQPRVLLKADGSINLFTKEGNVAGGAGMGIFVNADGSISLASHNGAAILVGTDGSIKIFNGSGSVQVTEDGSIKLASPAKVEISGGSITMGGPAALPLASGPSVVSAITALQVEVAAIAAALVACMNIAGPIIPATHGAAAGAATAAVATAGISLALVAPTMLTKRTIAD